MTALARAVAAHGLRSSLTFPTAAAGQPTLDRETFDALLAECTQHRVLGFLGDAVRDGALVVDDEQREKVEEELRSWLAHDVRIEQLLLRALSALEAEGIPSRVLKGVALAHTAYPRPESRVFGDVDLLVPSGEVGRAVTTLERTFGVTREQPELRPGFDERFGKEVLLRCDEDLELDLHRVFVEGALGLTIRTADLFAPPYRFPLAGYELAALPMPQRLLHACYAAALGDWPPRLGSLRDVAQIVLRESPHLVDVLLMAQAWQCQLVVARAIRLASEELGLLDRPAIVEWAYRYRPGRKEEVVLAAHEGPARAFTRHLAALLVLPGVAARAAYLRAIAFPQRSYLEARAMTAGGHVGRAWRRLKG
jgi:hypothetical protein